MLIIIRTNIEKERGKNCIFISFLRTRNEGMSGLTINDSQQQQQLLLLLELLSLPLLLALLLVVVVWY